MEFPIVDLLGAEACERWLLEHLHPHGLKCPRCGAGVEEAHRFRQTKKSRLTVYRCNHCKQPYNLYSRTVFEKWQVTVQQAVLLIRGVVQGEPSNRLAAELGLHKKTVLDIRHDLQYNARRLQPDMPQKYLAGYVAICEFRRNLKRVSPSFISPFVAFHSFHC
jgi:transposase-like protein